MLEAGSKDKRQNKVTTVQELMEDREGQGKAQVACYMVDLRANLHKRSEYGEDKARTLIP